MVSGAGAALPARSPHANMCGDRLPFVPRCLPVYSAAVGEADIYTATNRVLLAAGVRVAPPVLRSFGSGDSTIHVNEWPHVVIAPSLSLTFQQ